jgi:hypothetical protein
MHAELVLLFDNSCERLLRLLSTARWLSLFKVPRRWLVVSARASSAQISILNLLLSVLFDINKANFWEADMIRQLTVLAQYPFSLVV